MKWQWLVRALLIIHAAALTYLFWWGPRGWRDVEAMCGKLGCINQEVTAKKTIVAQLEQEESQWQTDLFNKERIAREELQMARAGDTVYYR